MKALPPSARQEIRHAVSVVNSEVPLRVFKGSDFADALGLDDIEVDEDGQA